MGAGTTKRGWGKNQLLARLAVALIFPVAGGLEAAFTSGHMDLYTRVRLILGGALFLLPVGLLFAFGLPFLGVFFQRTGGRAIPPGAGLKHWFTTPSSPASPSTQHISTNRLTMARWCALLPSVAIWAGVQFLILRALHSAVNTNLAATLGAMASVASGVGALVLFVTLSGIFDRLLGRLFPNSPAKPVHRQWALITLLLCAAGAIIATVRYWPVINATHWEPVAAWLCLLTIGFTISLLTGSLKQVKGTETARLPHLAAGSPALPPGKSTKWKKLVTVIGVLVLLPLWYFPLNGLLTYQTVREPLRTRTWFTAPVFQFMLFATDFDRDGASHMFGGGDCAPFNPHIHPGAREIPGDGIDNNCIAGDAQPNQFRFTPLNPPVLDGAIETDPELILLITVDALRYDRLGAAGYERPLTPAIDSLASHGVLYKNAYSHTPATRWMIPLLLTGRYPSQIKWDTTTWPHTVLPEVPTLPQYLGEAGYRTEAIWTFTAHMGLNRAFDKFDHSLRKERPGSDKVTQNAIATIDKHFKGQAPRGDAPVKPLFLWIHYFDPHHPYLKREGFDFGGSDKDRYDSEVAATDRDIGILLDHLKGEGLYDKSTILLTADHGEAFGEHGKRFHSGTLYNEMIRIPFILKTPGLKPGIEHTPTGLIDVAPTLLSLVPAFDQWDDLMGYSLLDAHREEDWPVFGTLDFLTDYKAPQRMIISDGGRYKTIVDFGNGLMWCFDMVNDPFELHNLADRRKKEINKLLPLLEAWYEWVITDGTL